MTKTAQPSSFELLWRKLAPEARGRRASENSDDHHQNVLGNEFSTSLSTLDGYLQRVEALAARDRLFEKVEIEINLGCNRSCNYCFLATKKREHVVSTRFRRMDFQLYEKLLEQLQALSFAGVLCYHFYSEPLLNLELEKYVRAAKNILPATRSILYTNGDFLDRPRFEELRSSGIDVFAVTRHDNDIPAHIEDLLQEEELLLDARSEMRLNNRAGYLGPVDDQRISQLPCIYPAEAVIVTIDGNVLPCSCDFYEQSSFGNIRNQNIGDIYFSEKAVQFRHDLLAGRREKHALCASCDCYSEALGLSSAAEPFRDPTLIQLPSKKSRHADKADR